MKPGNFSLKAIILCVVLGTATHANTEMKFDGKYNIQTSWSYDYCGTQNIEFTVEAHEFSFEDAGEFVWEGTINDRGWTKIVSQPGGHEVTGGGLAPVKTGLEHAIWNSIHWKPCGVAMLRIHRIE